jgi:hypothetical protein
MPEPLTDAELDGFEAQLREIAAYWDKPALVPAIHPDMVLDLVAEVRRLHGMRCETCAEWDPDFCGQWNDGLPRQGKCELGGRCEGEWPRYLWPRYDDSCIYTRADFGCREWRSKP